MWSKTQKEEYRKKWEICFDAPNTFFILIDVVNSLLHLV